MPAVRFWSLLIITALLIAGCSGLDSVFTGTKMCSAYNDQRDGFQMSIRDGATLLAIGAEHRLTINRSWLDINLRRESLNCNPEWEFDPVGVVEIDGVTVTALSPGTVRATAIVTGRAGTKTSSVNLAVVPNITETEPNNGRAAANALVAGTPMIGHNDYSGDEDWFYADLGAGASLQFTLRRSIDNRYGYFSYSASGSVYNEEGKRITGANQVVDNPTASTVRVYLRVTSSGAVPYSVSVDYF